MVEHASQRRQDEPTASPPSGLPLLDAVLTETLQRGPLDEAGLLQRLADWARGCDASELDATASGQLVAEVLRHRLGDRFSDLPPRMCDEIGVVLWNDPVSRQRMGRLWQHLLTIA